MVNAHAADAQQFAASIVQAALATPSGTGLSLAAAVTVAACVMSASLLHGYVCKVRLCAAMRLEAEAGLSSQGIEDAIPEETAPEETLLEEAAPSDVRELPSSKQEEPADDDGIDDRCRRDQGQLECRKQESVRHWESTEVFDSHKSDGGSPLEESLLEEKDVSTDRALREQHLRAMVASLQPAEMRGRAKRIRIRHVQQRLMWRLEADGNVPCAGRSTALPNTFSRSRLAVAGGMSSAPSM
mmetsp:Transcript_35200/g.104152  ORF Transcript_35200/g.104152 Transcript_35200/m.104152 type:complete len:242 (-) Transcript_35200:445-1170(-)|eukprot:297846-Chlamydomonas_euryale.AAC.7